MKIKNLYKKSTILSLLIMIIFIISLSCGKESNLKAENEEPDKELNNDEKPINNGENNNDNESNNDKEPNEYIHDPSRIVELNGYLYYFASGNQNKNGIDVWYKAPDSDKWKLGKSPYPAGGEKDPEIIDFINDVESFDAPGVYVDDDSIVLYYTAFDEHPDEEHGYNVLYDIFGKVYSKGNPPNLTWHNDGAVVKTITRSDGKRANHPRAMDASVLDDDKLWLVFGSHAGGIYIVELDRKTGKLKKHSEDIWASKETKYPERFIKVAYNEKEDDVDGIVHWGEAPYIYKHPENGYYYLFYNQGECCRGIKSTYYIVVGRSKSVKGPYFDEDNVSLLNGGGTIFLDSKGKNIDNEKYIGPGHAGIYQFNEDSYCFSFHYYDGEKNGMSNAEFIEISFNNEGWPEFKKIGCDF